MFVFYCIEILETSSREVVIEKPRTNETSIPSEQLLPVKEVSEEKWVVVFYSYVIASSFLYDSFMNQYVLSFTLSH